MLDPSSRVLHRISHQPAAMHPTILMPLHQPRPFQHAQVFGHGWQRHLVRRCKLAYRSFAQRQARQMGVQRQGRSEDQARGIDAGFRRFGTEVIPEQRIAPEQP